jgi:two-component system, chemotaxis family, chemotaxis protein CheY
VNTAVRLLVVDDDPDGVEAMRFLLESSGFSVDTASNGREALQTMRRGPSPDVVILDLLMPVMNGWEFLDEVRHDDRLASIPVIVVTGSFHTKPSAFDGKVFVKPVDFDALVNHVQHLCPHQ